MHLLFILLLILIIILLLNTATKSGAGEVYRSTLLPQKQEKYYDRPREELLCYKNGQRKLLISELEFLNTYDSKYIIYAGAAPGRHITLLAEIFPRRKFILYDPREFSTKLLEYKNIELRQKFFLEDDCNEINKLDNFVFLSDIRTGSDEENVADDMEFQRKWCEILKAKMFCLKFRLPWSAGKTKYFDGEVHLQPWNGCESAETRLWTDCKKIKEYDNDEYNNKIFYFHKYYRQEFYDVNKKGYDNCWDCWAENNIIENNSINLDKINNYINLDKINKATNSNLDTPPHNLFPEERDIKLKLKLLKDLILDSDKIKSNFKKQLGKVNESMIEKYNVFMRPDPKLYKLLFSNLRGEKNTFPVCAPQKPHYSELLSDLTRREDIAPYNYYLTDIRRRFFVSRLAFLSKHSGNVVIITDYLTEYIPRLAEIFKDKIFYIYFPHYYANINAPNVKIFYKPLTLKDSKKYTGELLIYELLTNTKSIEIQKLYCEFMCPKAASLIFYRGIPKSFYESEIYLSAWGNEKIIRVEVTKFDREIKYNSADIQKKFNAFNCIRLAKHIHDAHGAGIDSCWDCWCEANIWKRLNLDPSIEMIKSPEITIPPHGSGKFEPDRILYRNIILKKIKKNIKDNLSENMKKLSGDFLLNKISI
jgi:hypothetical protein